MATAINLNHYITIVAEEVNNIIPDNFLSVKIKFFEQFLLLGTSNNLNSLEYFDKSTW